MVAQYAVIEQARALLDLAVMSEGGAFSRAIAGARAFISEASVTFGHEMIQMHGGMGVSDELNIGHGHKRLMLLSRYPETAAVALDRYAEITTSP
jgi:alkylation response protein AidB-like acyl-CoA dehydrogenase